MRKVFVLLSFTVLVCASSSALAVPIQWTIASGGNDHWYDLTPTKVTWHQADAWATSSIWNGMRGYLASVLSQAENDFLFQLLPADGFWIGFTDEAQEGTWVWSSGEAVGYTNWLPSEPSNSWPPDGEDYCVMYTQPQYAGKWNDVPETNPPIFGGQAILQYGIVEYNNVPEPTSFLLLGTGIAAMGLAAWRRKK